jgi:hypothetical protein
MPLLEARRGHPAACVATQDSADTLSFGNNSSMRVATSMRSGTLQYLHVSEFGKICAQAPDKAREIVTGALNTVAAGQFIVIESTAEGQEGAFYEMAQRARERALSGVALTPLDYKFHFFPWWQDQAYHLNDAAVVIGAEDERYFSGLEESGVKLASRCSSTSSPATSASSACGPTARSGTKGAVCGRTDHVTTTPLTALMHS